MWQIYDPWSQHPNQRQNKYVTAMRIMTKIKGFEIRFLKDNEECEEQSPNVI